MSRQARAQERAAWLRRAETIHRKAADLLADMVSAVGSDHDATDFADAVVERAEELTSILSKPGLSMWALSTLPQDKTGA